MNPLAALPHPNPLAKGEGDISRRAFTLLEIVLALALSVLVFGLVGMAIDIHLRVADSSRVEVEQAQLARALLQRMADDLRNAVPLTSGTLSSGTSSSGASSSGTSSSGTSSSGTSSSGASSSGMSSSGTSSSGAASSGASSSGGVVGDSYQVQVETSRPPRAARPDTAATTGDVQIAARLSDIRTVTYSVIEPGDPAALDATRSSSRTRGLARGELDSATFAWSLQQGQTDEINRATTILAPEVESVEFTYLDGGEEHSEWDSSEQGKLPTAVRITIYLRSPPPRSALFAPSAEGNPPVAYNLLVYLPNADAARDETGQQGSQESTAKSADAKAADTASKDAKTAEPISPGAGPAKPRDKASKSPAAGPTGTNPVGPVGKPVGPVGPVGKPTGPVGKPVGPVGPGTRGGR